MRGKIAKYSDYHSTGYILGDDGITYFFHVSALAGRSQKQGAKKGWIVEFEAEDVGKDHLQATQIEVVSIGINHPACHDVRKAILFIYDNVPESEERKWIIRDLRRISRYFEDNADKIDGRTFRADYMCPDGEGIDER